MDAAHQRAHDLEERVARHFAANGYDASVNVLVEGRSGGRHEVDVLARKSDRLTSFTVVVECKSQAVPVDKDAVSKLAFVLDDLGANKGIFVATAGYRPGAEQAARSLGIELWGADEVRRMLLGEVAHAAVREADGVRPRIPEGRALAVARSDLRGILRRERLCWHARCWLPAYQVALACSRTGGAGRARTVATRAWNLYEPLSGALVARSHQPFEASPVALDRPLILPLITGHKLVADIRHAVEGYLQVHSTDAVQRHALALASIGIEAPLRAVDVEEVRVLHLPLALAMARRRKEERLVAVSLANGRILEEVGAALTSSMRHVLGCLGERHAP